MAVYESVLCLKQEVFVYRIPARTTNRGYRAAEWKLDEPDWTGRLKVVAKEKDLFIKLEDKTSGELFAQSPIESYPSSAIEQVLDSSRYFVVRIQDGSARHAFIGLGFADRGDSFDLLVAIQDHFKQVKREKVETERCNTGEAEFSAAPKLDLGFKEGQTITLNFAAKKTGDAASAKPRPKVQPGASPILLPPPPGGVKISGPPRPSPMSQQHQQQQPSSAPAGVAVNNMQSTVPMNPAPAGGNMDLLLDLDVSSSASRSAAPHGTNDNWDDFASVGGRPSTQTTTDTKTLAWENFD